MPTEIKSLQVTQNLSPETKGRIFLLLAAVLWSLSGLIVKNPAFDNFSSQDRPVILAFYRAVFAAMFLAVFVRRKHISFRKPMIPMCLSFSAMNFLYITAMTLSTAAAAIFLQYTSTIWVFLFGILFWKEVIDRGNLVALVFAIFGITVIVASDWQGENFTGNLVGMASGFTYAGVILSLRALRKENAIWLILLNHTASIIVLIPFMAVAGIWSLSWYQLVLVSSFGIVQMAIPYVLFAKGVGYVKMQEAALIPLIEPIMNPLWVLIFWGEQASSYTWLGGSLILLGMAIKYLFFMPRSVQLVQVENSP